MEEHVVVALRMEGIVEGAMKGPWAVAPQKVEEGGVFGVKSGLDVGGEVPGLGYESLGNDVVMYSFGASGEIAGSG